MTGPGSAWKAAACNEDLFGVPGVDGKVAGGS